MNDSVDHRLHKIAQGDHNAFADLYNQYWKIIYDQVYGKVKNTAIAEDIVHDLFLSLWRNKERVCDILNLPAYLQSGARYLIFTHFNRHHHKENHLHISDLDIMLQETPLEDRLHYRYLLDLLHEEIENLPERCKLIFKASRIEQKSIAEIALEFNLSKSTIENQINIALKRLKRVTSDFKSIIAFF